jgi:hypothetical protein
MQDLTGKVLEEDGEGGGPDYTVFLRKTDGYTSYPARLGNGTRPPATVNCFTPQTVLPPRRYALGLYSPPTGIG